MVNIISDSSSVSLEHLVKNSEYIIGVRGKGIGRLRGGQKKFSVRNITRIVFKRGEEKDAIKLFVDINKPILMSDPKFRYKSSFYPQMLHKYFYQYLINGKLDENIPLMSEYGIKRSREHTKDAKFCQYMRERCNKLLENPESILHDCSFINKYYDGHQKERK